MTIRRKLDQQPGPVPDIQIASDCVVYRLDVPDAPGGVRLAVRCGPRGEVWAAIESATPPFWPFTAGD